MIVTSDQLATVTQVRRLWERELIMIIRLLAVGAGILALSVGPVPVATVDYVDCGDWDLQVHCAWPSDSTDHDMIYVSSPADSRTARRPLSCLLGTRDNGTVTIHTLKINCTHLYFDRGVTR